MKSRSPKGDGFVGFDATGWEANVWILHAMYETDELPEGLSHDDVYRMELEAGTVEPLRIGEIDLDQLLGDAQVTGTPSGGSGWPGPGWKRLLWSLLGTRLEVDPFGTGYPPSDRSFPYRSWPISIEPPSEGSLDREQFVRLLELLPRTERRCFAFYGMLASGDFDNETLYEGHLDELADLFDNDELSGSPTNFWAADESWFVYTDWDLWATKVSGATELIERLAADPELETVALDPTRRARAAGWADRTSRPSPKGGRP